MRDIVATFGLTLVLSGCTPGGRLAPLDPGLAGLEPPEGTVLLENGVDPVLVGDRLTEAGQHDLALRAYTRAAAEQGMSVEILSAIGSSNLQLGRLGQADTQLRRAIDLDETYVPAWNNLGVVLMEQGEFGEARRSFETAFALDSGRSDAIRENLRRAIARMENAVYDAGNDTESPGLIRQSDGVYVLMSER